MLLDILLNRIVSKLNFYWDPKYFRHYTNYNYSLIGVYSKLRPQNAITARGYPEFIQTDFF